MKSLRGLLVCKALLLCAVMVLGAMTWLTRGVLASEKERADAEARADLEQRTRLALWRMDAVGSALLLRENQRPPAEFHANPQDPFAPNEANPLVNLHFEVRFGSLMSPEAADSPAKLQTLRQLLSKNGNIDSILNHAAESGEKSWQALQKEAPELQSKIAETNNSGYATKRGNQAYQDDSNRMEKIQRAKVMEGQEASSAVVNQNTVIASNALSGIEGITEIGSMRGVWIDRELFLLRNVSIRAPGGQVPVIQGVWMDAAKVRPHLLAAISELLPIAGLDPIFNPDDPGSPFGTEANPGLEMAGLKADDPMALVSFPFRLHRNSTIGEQPLPWNKPLLVGWGAVVLALLTAAWLVRGVMLLSERRASFVSAVTHELRTPLTTFRLYSDMLESGAVKPEKRGEYLRVLSREADRLSHLVENVLSFSQIERGSARSVVRDSTVRDLLEPMRERLEARLATAGMTLEMNSDCDRSIRVDTAAVEHILFNLVDNSAKYAATGDPPRLKIGIKVAEPNLEIVVSDHGPGIPISERRRIFRAFHKSARQAAESQPGVGLGLALSRRLAKSLGGALICKDVPQGACFILRLPLT